MIRYRRNEKMMKEIVITAIRHTLKDCVDEKTLKSSSRFFKEGEATLVYGVGMKEVDCF